jgi:hypothetical protein
VLARHALVVQLDLGAAETAVQGIELDLWANETAVGSFSWKRSGPGNPRFQVTLSRSSLRATVTMIGVARAERVTRDIVISDGGVTRVPLAEVALRLQLPAPDR